MMRKINQKKNLDCLNSLGHYRRAYTDFFAIFIFLIYFFVFGGTAFTKEIVVYERVAMDWFSTITFVSEAIIRYWFKNITVSAVCSTFLVSEQYLWWHLSSVPVQGKRINIILVNILNSGFQNLRCKLLTSFRLLCGPHFERSESCH